MWILLILLAGASPALAQSFLGTLRGTVTDAQGAVVSGASVLIIDEDSGATRTIDTDTEGRYEAARLRPGTYRVEVVAPSFKKFEKTGIVLRAAGTALVDIALELGALAETVTVTAETENNITLDSQAIARGLDQQQLHDLPRNSRDVRDFLLLNPNVVGGFDDMQFLGSRTYGVSYIQDGQASTNAIFGTIGNSAPGLDSVAEIQVLSNWYSAEYGGLAGVVVTTKRGGNAYHGTSFYDFNSDGLNALTYNQTLAGVERGDPLSDTHEHRWGGSMGGPLVHNKLFFYANYEGSNDKAIYGGARINVPTEAMRNGDFRGTAVVPKDPDTGEPFADQMIPGNRIDQAARNIMNFFYPLPNQGVLANGYGVFQQFVPQTRKRHRGDIRIDHQATQNDTFFCPGRISAPGPEQHSVRGARQRLHQLSHREHEPRHGLGGRRVDQGPVSADGQRVPRGLQLRQLESGKATSAPAMSRPSSASRRRPVSPTCEGFRASRSRARTGRRAFRIRGATSTGRSGRTRFRSATTSRGSRADIPGRSAACGTATRHATASGLD